MALKLTRLAGTVVYGGWDLNPNDLENSYDHRLLIRTVRDSDEHNAVINVSINGVGVEEHVLRVGGDTLMLENDVEVGLENVHNYTIRETPYCPECERGGEDKKVIPQASFAFSAPREYQILRDDARKKR
ncbi:MAG: hypothetical protein KJO69_03590 [Gammaproteobacteria bacterium]|nr:hypothetical protein [Gammaproteobacteria bacterium]